MVVSLSESEDDDDILGEEERPRPEPTADAAAEAEARRQRDYVLDTNLLLDKKWYINKDVFLAGIQDPGAVDPKTGEQQLIHFPVMKTMASKMFHKMKEHQFPNLPANVSRVTPVIINAITTKRDLVGVNTCDREFRKYSADGLEVYLIQNNTMYYGYNRILQEVHYFFYESKKKKEKDRSPADAIRVAAIMLDPANRKAVTLMLSGTRQSRAQADQSVDPSLAWAMDAVDQFNDDMYVVDDCHHDIDPSDVRGIDPNSTGGVTRDAKWFLDTWKVYLKKKYKESIRKWDTETGGGSHEPQQFSNFCNKDRWLVWVYMMDRSSGFLLFHIAKGQPPEHVGRESGGDICESLFLSDNGGAPGGAGYSEDGNGEDDDCLVTPARPVTLFSKRKRSAIDSCRKDFQQHQTNMTELLQYHRNKMQETPSNLYAQSIEAHKRLEDFRASIAYLPLNKRAALMKGAKAEVRAIHEKMLAAIDPKSLEEEGSGDDEDI
jgi:hypothetical protein